MACLAVVTVLRAQETPSSTPGSTQQSASPAPAAEPAPAAGTDDDKETPATTESPAATPPAATSGPPAKPRASGAKSTGPSPSRFEPTEKVRADFDVSFPTDI